MLPHDFMPSTLTQIDLKEKIERTISRNLKLHHLHSKIYEALMKIQFMDGFVYINDNWKLKKLDFRKNEIKKCTIFQ